MFLLNHLRVFDIVQELLLMLLAWLVFPHLKFETKYCHTKLLCIPECYVFCFEFF